MLSYIVPLEIIHCIFTYLDLPDLRKLLQDQVFADFSSYAVRQRAKTQAWEVAVFTPAGYAAALCHGDPSTLALAQLRCVGYDTQGLHFEPVWPPQFRDMCDQLPETLKLCWTRRLTVNDDDKGIRIVWSQGDHLVEQGGMQIRYRCKVDNKNNNKMMGGAAATACRMCGANCSGERSTVQLAIDRVSVSFEWMDRQLLL